MHGKDFVLFKALLTHKHWALALPPNTALVPVPLLAVARHAVRPILLCIVSQISLHSPCSYKELHCPIRSCLSAEAEEQGLGGGVERAGAALLLHISQIRPKDWQSQANRFQVIKQWRRHQT